MKGSESELAKREDRIIGMVSKDKTREKMVAGGGEADI